MTAHPESVVGRLRAAEARTAAQSFPSTAWNIARSAEIDCRAAFAPALLAALEKVWMRVQEAKMWEGGSDAHYHVAAEIKSDLAPLFTSSETPYHD